jgi:Transposase DDE domain group 1
VTLCTYCVGWQASLNLIDHVGDTPGLDARKCLLSPVGSEFSRLDQTGVRGTSQVKDKHRLPWLSVIVGGESLVSHAGGSLLVATARGAGLSRELSARLGPWRRPLAIHDPGKIVLDLAVAVALGGDCAADVAVLRAQPGGVRVGERNFWGEAAQRCLPPKVPLSRPDPRRHVATNLDLTDAEPAAHSHARPQRSSKLGLDDDADVEQWCAWLAQVWAQEPVVEAVTMASPALAARVGSVCG